jgi:hypothetical protein
MAMRWIEEYLYYPATALKKWQTVLDSWNKMKEATREPDIQGEACEAARPRPDLNRGLNVTTIREGVEDVAREFVGGRLTRRGDV